MRAAIAATPSRKTAAKKSASPTLPAKLEPVRRLPRFLSKNRNNRATGFSQVAAGAKCLSSAPSGKLIIGVTRLPHQGLLGVVEMGILPIYRIFSGLDCERARTKSPW